MERALEGVSAAPGVTIGPATVLDTGSAAATVVAPERRGDELSRARAALNAVAGELGAIASRLRGEGRDSEADIVETGVLMAGDPGLVDRVESLVMSGLAAPEALRSAARETASALAALEDPTLALRADDVRSVGRRAAARAAGLNGTASQGILIADTLGPADVAELAGTATGIALAGGGVTSHAAIVARSLGLPMVIGLGAAVLDTHDGEEVVIDGDHGLLVRSPGVARAASARDVVARTRVAREVAIANRTDPSVTRDGRRIRVLANASTVAELEEALEQGAEGVGLMRTELLFLEAHGWPTFEIQVQVMRPVLARLAGQVATVRLFDFGGDKTPPFLQGVKKRGIEILLDAPDVLRTHARAVVEAGRGTQLRVLIPMVEAQAQVNAVRQLVGAGVQVGAMIETPKAAACASEIARVSDFLSIGTNDLTQLVLGLDREQSRKAPVMDVRVLRLIAQAMRAAREASISVDVCGEAASDPAALPVMVGFGADELSVAAARVGQAREWVRNLVYAACQREAARLLDEAGHASRERV
jgi:multiphosphoryl transfer protein